MDTVLLLIIFGLTVSNIFFLYLVWHYVNRNWEHILDIKNQIKVLDNGLDQTIHHIRSRDKRGK